MQSHTLQVAGHQVAAWEYAPAKPNGWGVVLVHGFNSDHREFGDLGENLAAKGYHVIAFDQEGFGESEGAPGRTELAVALRDIQAVRGLLAGRVKRLAVLGHSLGGAYAVAAAREGFDAGIAAHPVNSLWDELNPIEKLGYHVLGKRAVKRLAQGKTAGTIPFKIKYRHLFVSAQARARAEAAGFLATRVDLGNYEAARTQRATEWAKDVKVPCLVITSRDDRVVKPASSRAVYQAIPGRARWLEHSGGHSCFMDKDEALLVKEIHEFLSRVAT